MAFHSKDPDQCKWVLKTFGTKEKEELYKDNRTMQEWLQYCRDILAARRLDY